MSYNRTVARLRGVCILVVLLTHYKFEFDLPFNGPIALWTNGYFGVTAFFVVSGYLITSNIIARYGELGATRPLDFYARRASRIVPPLALLLAVLSAFGGSALRGLAIPPDQSLREMLWYAVTFRFNLYVQFVPGHMVLAWAVLWSLAVEEVFYLGYPLLAVLLKDRRFFIAMLSCVIAVGLVDRMTGMPIEQREFSYFGCFDSIAFGALIALLAPRYAGKFSRLSSSAIMATGTAIAATTYLVMPFKENLVVGPELVSLGTAMILFASRSGPPAPRNSRMPDTLAFLGDCSYELYLYHFVLFILLRGAFGPIVSTIPDALVFVAVLAITILICAAIRILYAERLNGLLCRLLDAGDRPAGVVRERQAAS